MVHDDIDKVRAAHFERTQKKIDYVNERIDFVHTAIPWNEKPSFDALFDGSNAHLLEKQHDID